MTRHTQQVWWFCVADVKGAYVADSAGALGDDLRASGRLAEAEAAYQRALDSTEAENGPAFMRLHIKASQVAFDRQLFIEAMGHDFAAERILRTGDSIAPEQLDGGLPERGQRLCRAATPP